LAVSEEDPSLAASLEDSMNLANDSLEHIILCMKEMRSGDDCVVSELLATANIIFVTLTSSGKSHLHNDSFSYNSKWDEEFILPVFFVLGGSIMKRSRRVDGKFLSYLSLVCENQLSRILKYLTKFILEQTYQ